MPWCALLTAVNNYNKSLEKLQDFFFKTETKTKTKTFIFVLEAPRDQDPSLEGYITDLVKSTCGRLVVTLASSAGVTLLDRSDPQI